MTHSNRQHSKAGRRAGQDGSQNREAILGAARQRFARDGFRATTMRCIAEDAGVTPAMLHYHFGNKRGLYFAVIESVAGPLLKELGGKRSEPGAIGLEAFFEIYMRTIATNPEMPSLVLQDVLNRGGEMRGEFAQRFAHRGRDIMSALLKTAQREGEVDPDLDVDLGVISLLSLALFPFLAAPLIREVFGIEWDEAQLDRLIEHQRSIFLDGTHGKTRRDGPGT